MTNIKPNAEACAQVQAIGEKLYNMLLDFDDVFVREA
jgi:hypothetical protein